MVLQRKPAGCSCGAQEGTTPPGAAPGPCSAFTPVLISLLLLLLLFPPHPTITPSLLLFPFPFSSLPLLLHFPAGSQEFRPPAPAVCVPRRCLAHPSTTTIDGGGDRKTIPERMLLPLLAASLPAGLSNPKYHPCPPPDQTPSAAQAPPGAGRASWCNPSPGAGTFGFVGQLRGSRGGAAHGA